jgi:hypothetical protein
VVVPYHGTILRKCQSLSRVYRLGLRSFGATGLAPLNRLGTESLISKQLPRNSGAVVLTDATAIALRIGRSDRMRTSDP